jgi:hypothetical protein
MNGNRYITWMLSLTAPSIAVVVAMFLATSTWERVKTTPQQRTIRVTGSATQRITSDLIEWQADVVTKSNDRTSAYRELKKQVDIATAYVKEQGVKPEEIRISSVTTEEVFRTEYIGDGEDRLEKQIPDGWEMSQAVSIRSKDIERVERVSREITQLIEKGVAVISEPPTYHFTKLDQLKIEMLARAAQNARERAAKIVTSAGGARLGALWDADMGVINVNPANSTETNWEGNNDKTSLEKDILTVVHLTFQLP